MRGSLVVLLVCAMQAQQPAGRPPLQDPNHETTTADVPGLTAATSRCAVADDPTYGLTATNPIKVGGGAMYMASREVKYLSALRGPAGEGVHFKRAGADRGPDGTILDFYMLNLVGNSTTTKLYIDGYRWATPRAPVGWLCGADMNLNPPGPDPFETQDQKNALAVRLGDQEVEPISLDPDGSKVHGAVFDHVRTIALAARAAAARGTPLDPKNLPRAVAQPHLVLVAFPITCEGKTIRPKSVAIADASGNSPPSTGTSRDDKISELLPGFTAPTGSVAVTYSVPSLIEGAVGTVRYEEPCGAAPADAVLPVKSERGRVTKSVPGVAPSGVAIPPGGTQVRVQVFLDADGTPLHPAYVSGPIELTDAAIDAAKQWRVEPPKMNGAPILQTVTLAIVFRDR